MIKRGRWRGRMPFRLNREYRRSESLIRQGRGGEPSPTHARASLCWWLDLLDKLRRESHGRAKGSFTERARRELWDWMKKNGLKRHSPISFQYRLHRHRTVTVVITNPNIWHRRVRGNGSKGFMLEGRILSVDGAPPAYGRVGEFALTRIMGQHPLRLLAEGNKP